MFRLPSTSRTKEYLGKISQIVWEDHILSVWMIVENINIDQHWVKNFTWGS